MLVYVCVCVRVALTLLAKQNDTAIHNAFYSRSNVLYTFTTFFFYKKQKRRQKRTTNKQDNAAI